MFIRRITLRNLLSFGPDETDLELGPLNVLIGPNGSGKSNLIAAIEILRAAPRDLAAPISDTGGIGEWLHKWESGDRRGSIGAEVDCPPLRYSLSIEEQNHEFQVYAELVARTRPRVAHARTTTTSAAWAPRTYGRASTDYSRRVNWIAGDRKGRDSFEILAELDPQRVTAASPHARRLVDVLRARL